MKIENLRKLIEDEGGKITIGVLEFRYRGKDRDIDVYFNNNLVMWCDNNVSGDKLVSEEDVFTISTEIKENANRAIDSEKEKREYLQKINELEKENVDLKGGKVQSEKSVGMVEAYEKILFNKKITIE